MKVSLAATAMISILVLVGLVSCSSSRSQGDNRSVRIDPIVLQGGQIYQNLCASCHEAKDLHLAQTPPPLHGLFRHPTLPTGAPATDDEVRRVILDGRGIMPPFQQNLDANDLKALLRYLHTR